MSTSMESAAGASHGGNASHSGPVRGVGHAVATRLIEPTLAAWQTLTQLDMSCNWIRAADWRALAISIRGNTQLVHLDLSDTGLGAGACSGNCGTDNNPVVFETNIVFAVVDHLYVHMFVAYM